MNSMATPTAAHVAPRCREVASRRRTAKNTLKSLRWCQSLLVESGFGMRSRVFTQPGPSAEVAEDQAPLFANSAVAETLLRSRAALALDAFCDATEMTPKLGLAPLSLADNTGQRRKATNDATPNAVREERRT